MAQARLCVESDHRETYVEALKCLKERDVQFMLGGAFAVWYYTGRWRDTHDMDIFTSPRNVPPAVAALSAAGFDDLGEQAPGDRDWIYHSIKGEIIVDIIWSFANRLTTVENSWIERAQEGDFLGVKVKFMPMEELVHSKIYTMNKHRCDWPDIMRILRTNCPSFDWFRFLDMIGNAWLLFNGIVNVFDWVYPAESHCIPDIVRQELLRRQQEFKPNPNAETREKLLDPWIHSRPEDICYWEP